MSDLPPDAQDGGDGDKEAHIDALVRRARSLLGEGAYRTVFDAGLGAILGDIRDDLEGFGVIYEEWFSERSLAASGALARAIERLRASGHTYERDGALWFTSKAPTAIASPSPHHSRSKAATKEPCT